MNKRMHNKVARRVLLALVAAILLFGIIAAPQAKASGYQASYIERLENALGVNLKEHANSNVMFQLPETIKEDDYISIIITLDVVNLMDAYDATDKTMSFAEFALQSEEAKKIEQQVSAEKAEILDKLDQMAISYTTGEEYSVLLTGFEIYIKAGDFKATCQSLGEGRDVMISEVYAVAETQLVENTVNVYDTGIINSSNVKFDGSGMVVAVLDTGLDYAHSAFSTQNFNPSSLGLTYEQVAALVGKTTASKQSEGLTVDDVFISDKVPFGFDYADGDADVYSTHNNHGTHVSGIIVGKDDTITGVAPNAQLVSMKVFSDTYDSAISSWILSALEDCVVLGVDVINMSLGTAAGFARESDEEKMWGVYDKIRDAGISLIVAASNSYNSAYGSEKNGNLPLTSNPDSGTVGSPGTYEGAMSVASINGVETPYIKFGETIIYFNETNTNAGKERNFFNTLLGDADAKEFEFVLIPGVGRSADYTGLDVKGKIALVRRGDNTFEEKAIIAQAQGAAGIIIYNNVAGDIKMNVGEATLAACSISQDDGEMLVAAIGDAGTGKIMISRDQTSGPFMSDFSSWGPTPSLNIKPEITQHGGNILSSVTGGDYDRLSGTSMACPNVAGLTLLLRQYVVENFPGIAGDSVAVNHMVYRLMMSTADIVINKNGLPYAVRKQGAGLANLKAATESQAVIITYGKDGKIMDKTKLELGDDPSKNGVYEMSFTVQNFGKNTLSYDLGAFVMTEGVSETLTNHGQTTVTEAGYLLGAAFEVVSVSGGTLSDKNLTVNAGSEAKVTVKITLTDADKQYLDSSFENGMYVEGFITLTATAGTDINMSVPYLAFYGDWTKAPMFDLDYFETNADELDPTKPVEDKVMPDAYSTTPIGGISGDYVSMLGSYYFLQNPEDMVISANKDYIALSNQDGTIHSLRFVWAGLLRSAEKIVVTITDDATGEVIYEVVDTDVRKSYGDGGSIYPANIEIEFDTQDYNLMNNSKYTVKLQGYMDYGNGGLETNEKNTFEFPLTIDFEAPVVEDVKFRYEYDKTLQKNRLYADIQVFDNHFAMSMQLGYITITTDENGAAVMEMKNFEQYMTPVYSKENSTTTVTVEMTDYIEQMKTAYSGGEGVQNGNAFVVTTYDYALNYATYEIGLPDNFVDFYMEGLEDGLTMSPNEIYNLMPTVYPDTEWAELLKIETQRSNVVRVVNGKLVAVGPGTSRVSVKDPSTNKTYTFTVTVLKEGDEGFVSYDKPVADIFELTGYYTIKAYYQLSSEDKDLGDTGDTRFFTSGYNLSMYPSESVGLYYKLDAYFPNETTVEYKSSNENIVEVSSSGVVTAKAEGFANISVNVLLDGKSTYYSHTITIEVKDPFITSGPNLTHYFGNGGIVTIPERLSLTTIGGFAFSNFTYEEKTPEELAYDNSSATTQRPIGDNTITKVVIPEGVETIGAYAFAHLTALEEVVLPSTLKQIEYYAFYGCTNLKKISFSGENNLKIINMSAFERCDLQGNLELPSAYVISDYAFAGNRDLTGISLPKTLQTIGSYAFAGCTSLKDVQISAEKVKYGAYAFMSCTALETFPVVNTSIIPSGMFYQSGLKSITIGPDVNAINEFAFTDSQLETFTVASGNTAFKVQSANYVISADGKQLVAVAPTVSGEFTADSIGGANVTSIGRGAFSHTLGVTSVKLENVTEVGDYGFGFFDESRPNRRSALRNVQLGQLTHVGEFAFYGIMISQMPEMNAGATIGKYAFSNTAITSVVIPDGMVIPEGMFYECDKLVSVTIGNNVTIGNFAFMSNINRHASVDSYYENDTKYYFWVFSSPLKTLTIGDNAIIGESAFANNASLTSVELGENAKIGYMAFYNCSNLASIDLSKAVTLGDYAFSGDVYYVFRNMDMTIPAVGSHGEQKGKYLYSYYASKLQNVDLSNIEHVGAYAFAYCRDLTDVVLGEGVTTIGEYAFASTTGLNNINLDKVQNIGAYAFMESGLISVDLSSATVIGEYAFVNCAGMDHVILNAHGTEIGEGAFAYNAQLSNVANLQYATVIGAYAFAYTGMTEADLSGAISIGDFAFLKEELSTFTVKLGSNLVTLGDNPWAMSIIEPFFTTESESFNGVEYFTENYTFQLSENVYVVDGSLYCKAANGGLELIVYTGRNAEHVQVADGTVRVGSHAFAGSNVQVVTLPYTVASVGHKAFFGCQQLKMVVFTSYRAPILEEEFDPAYYESLQNIPGSGDYGEYTDYDGTPVAINPIGMVKYFMWNATGGMYSNVYYGANFVDYIGYVDNKLTMVRPSNGQYYETFIFNQYFDLVVDGSVAADNTTLAAIAAINQIPERVELIHKDIVAAARAAYNLVIAKDQQALVSNFSKLLSAEQRITALESAEQDPSTEPEPQPEPQPANPVTTAIGCIAIALGLVIAVLYCRGRRASAKEETAEEAEQTDSEEETEAEAEAETKDEE